MFETTSIWGAVLRTNTLSQHQLCQCTYVQHLGSTRPWAYCMPTDKRRVQQELQEIDSRLPCDFTQYIYILYMYILICQNSSIWESLDALADFAPGAGCEGGPVAATTGDTRGRGPEWEQWWRWAETRLKRYEQNLKTCSKLEVWRNKSCSARPGHVQEDLPGMERTFEIGREPNTWSVPRKEVGTLGHTFSHSSISVRPFATLTALL